jgi:CheY-like chemotaxis protein
MDTKSKPNQVGRRLPLVMAIINTNDDLVQLLREKFIERGFQVVTAHIRDIKSGRQDFSAFLNAHNPSVIVYDITVPYEDAWTFFQTLLQLPEAHDRDFVVTTVNKRVLDQRVGPNEAIEIQGGRADDLEPVIEAVEKRAQARV